MSTKVLEGVKVVELCQMVAGPYCGKLLSDMGADVLKVEPPLGGDAARRQAPFVHNKPDQEGSVLFLYLNTGKRSIQLDISDPLGGEIVRRLVAGADVLLEDCSPETSERLGLRYSDLESVNPDLVVTFLTPFGITGPYKDYKAYPMNSFHSGGEGYLSPLANTLYTQDILDRPPLKQARYVGEYEAALCAAIPTLAAIYHSSAGGGGQQVDVSKQEALLGLNYLEMHAYLAAGQVPTRTTRMMDIGGIMRCKDGYVEFCLHEEHQWRGLVKMLGDPEWAEEEWAQKPDTRLQRTDVINRHLRDWLPRFTKAEVMRQGQQAGTTVALYNTIDEVVESEQMKVREYFRPVTHPELGTYPYPSAAYRFAGEAPTLRPAPALGQHNMEVYCGELGFSLEEVGRMRELGTI